MAGKKRTFLTALGKPAKERRQIARRKSSFGAERARARVDSETHLRRRGANRPFAYRAQAGEPPVYRFTLEDLDELAGYVAAEANHAKDKKLEKELYRLYARIAAALESYTDENDTSTR